MFRLDVAIMARKGMLFLRWENYSSIARPGVFFLGVVILLDSYCRQEIM